MAKQKKGKKDQIVKLNTSFDELVNMSVSDNPKPKSTSTKKPSAKK